MADFCASGVSVIVAARGQDGRAIPGHALGARAEPGGRVRILLRQPANRALLMALATGSPIAATFTRPHDHRSIQLKSRGAEILEPAAEDMTALAIQAATFRDVLVSMDYTPAFSALYSAYAPGEIVVVSFAPEQAFVQTPGPGAGGEIKT